jgi:hypothetical protein
VLDRQHELEGALGSSCPRLIRPGKATYFRYTRFVGARFEVLPETVVDRIRPSANGQELEGCKTHYNQAHFSPPPTIQVKQPF